MPTRFLIVDDLEENRKLLGELIRRRFKNTVIDEADSGSVALRRIQTHPPDILVLDVLMPDMDGFEVCNRIKSDPNTSSILVMMVSAYMTNASSRISGLESGADSYICKPFENDEFLAQLTALKRILHTEKTLSREQNRLKAELNARKLIEKQLESAKLAAESAARAKSEFLAHMSHEIRTPMNAVIGMTEILMNTPLTPEQQEYVRTIHTSGETLLMVINDILDQTKIDSGKLTLEERPFRLDDILDDAFSMVKNQADYKGLRLVSNIADGVPLNVIGDSIRFKQIVSNLLSNAVKFTESGEIQVNVSGCRMDRSEFEIQLSVRDTGIGIPADRMSRLFQPFSQVDDSTSRKFGGTGLGLVICKRLCEIMGGSIRVESEEGRGSVFHVRVRLRYEKERQPSNEVADQESPMAGSKVMILDDNEVNRRLLARQMESWGMTTVEVSSPDKAVDMLRDGYIPDLALVDMRMPGLDGIEFARLVREKKELRKLPLVLLSSADLSQSEQNIAAVEAGIGQLFSARLHKPVESSALFDVIISILRRKPDTTAEPADPVEAGSLRVLVAEDNQVNRKVAEYMLRRLGCTCDFAEDGRAAVAAARNNLYDLILMDVQMPHMDGIEAMQAIRNECAGGQTPFFVALTAHAMQGDREKYLAAGMDDYISKPVREKELSRVIEKCAAMTKEKVGDE